MGIQTSGQGTSPGSGAIRCPSCGGLNPAGADWCGQCLRSFAPPSPPPPPPPSPAPVAQLDPRPEEQAIDEYFDVVSKPPEADIDPLERRPAGAAGPLEDPLDFEPLGVGAAADFAVTEREHVAPVVPLTALTRPIEPEPLAEVKWTCGLCDTPNPLAANVCEACGSSFADTMRPSDHQVAGDPNQAALYSLFWPGAGHAYLGQWGQAVARAVMSAWVLLVTAFLLFGGGGGVRNVFALFFGLAATALWLVAAHDAHREASGQPSLAILQGRRYLYATGMLLGLLFLMLLVSAAAAAS